MIAAILLFGAVLANCPAGSQSPQQSRQPSAQDLSKVTPRRPVSDVDLAYWLRNMVSGHGFSVTEVMTATGLSEAEVEAAVTKFRIPKGRPTPNPRAGRLSVLPYPGGRHPRIGFLDGAIDPQRETKVSIFSPWSASSYLVVDVPEAIFCQDGILYLAHTHVPTLWTQKNIALAPLEWKRKSNGVLDIERILPNGASFGARVSPKQDHVEMELWLRNGTEKTLTGLRVQVCAMLRGADGFDQQTNDNKIFKAPHAAAHSADGKRWIVMAWERCGRAWGNPPCPCLHSDPVFADCPPGKTVRVKGLVWFYEGSEAEALGRFSP